MQNSESPSPLSPELAQLRAENAALSSQLATAIEKMQGIEKSLKQKSAINHVLDQHSTYIITTPDGITCYASDGFCRLSQYTQEELIGKNANMVNSGYHSASFWENLWHTIRQGRMWQGKIRNQAKDGSYFWIDMNITPLYDEQGKMDGYLAIRKDITSSKQAEAQMRFDAHILSHISEAVVGLDVQYLVNYWNQGAEKQYGLSVQEVMGKSLADAYTSIWINPGDEHKAMQSLVQSGSCKVEIIHRLKDGRELYVEATTQILVNEAGENAGLLALIRDITDRKKAEQVLNHTLQELEKRNHELDNYVYKVSHDLRAPLTSMQGLLNLIKLETKLEVKEQYLALIENRVGKLDEYIQSILYHSQMVNAALAIAPINFEQLIKESFEELKHYLNWQKIELKIFLHGQKLFYSDEFRITVILRNIITNAIKYMNPGVEQNYLHFDITNSPTKVLIKAMDNGLGIEGQYLDKIFDMFFRATASAQGSGLGLYIVKQAIEKLQGSIKVESRKGAGTTLIIELPNLSEIVIS